MSVLPGPDSANQRLIRFLPLLVHLLLTTSDLSLYHFFASIVAFLVLFQKLLAPRQRMSVDWKIQDTSGPLLPWL